MGEFSGQQVDLYDWEVAKIQQEIMPPIIRDFSRKAATQKNLDEMSMRIKDGFLSMGLVVHVNTAEAYLSVGPPKVEIVSRLEDHADSKYGHDHEHKRDEVLKSRALGEDFLGQKFKRKGNSGK